MELESLQVPAILEPYESSLNPVCLWSMLKALFYYHSVQRQNCFLVKKKKKKGRTELAVVVLIW